MPDRIKRVRELMIIGFILYLISFILPAHSGGGTGNIIGISCASVAIMYGFMGIVDGEGWYSIGMFYGSLANIFMFITFLVNVMSQKRSRLEKYCIANIFFCITSVLIWLFLTSLKERLIGYYVWAFSVGLTSIAFYTYRIRLSEWVLEKEKEAKNK